MNKKLSLIKTCCSQDMSLFKIQSKKASGKTKILIPIFLAIILMGYAGASFYGLMEQFKPLNLEYVTLTIYTFLFSIITLFEGLYKSSSLLFNCKDDDLLLSLPISKRTVLFIRMFKFYLFELLFNSMFILPCMIVYGCVMNPSWTYYLVSFFTLILLPIIPIVLSCLFGFITTYISSKFKGKTLIQTIITMAAVLVTLYYSYNFSSLTQALTDNAQNINDVIIKIYYPVGAYISLINDFNILTFIIYILVHVGIFAIAILLIGKFYFVLNSKMKSVTIVHNNKPYVIKTRSVARSFVKKEFNRFVQTPVFIVNAGFGLVLFIVACIAVCFKFNDIAAGLITKVDGLTVETITSYIPVGILALVAISSLMTSITSSMISLEGKSFNLLKSLPIESAMIVLYKVLASLIIILPCILFGDLIVFMYFKLDIVSIICILYGSILLPFISEIIGIMCNLKYPKMDSINDTEVVKQSMSSMTAVFIGMALSMGSVGLLIGLVIAGLSNFVIMLIYLILFTILAILLWLRVSKTAIKSFNDIQV